MIGAEYLFQSLHKLLLLPSLPWGGLQLFGLRPCKDLLTALIPTGVSAVSEGKSSLYRRKRHYKEKFFIAENFF
jgi:hypothetical protein